MQRAGDIRNPLYHVLNIRPETRRIQRKEQGRHGRIERAQTLFEKWIVHRVGQKACPQLTLQAQQVGRRVGDPGQEEQAQELEDHLCAGAEPCL